MAAKASAPCRAAQETPGLGGMEKRGSFARSWGWGWGGGARVIPILDMSINRQVSQYDAPRSGTIVHGQMHYTHTAHWVTTLLHSVSADRGCCLQAVHQALCANDRVLAAVSWRHRTRCRACCNHHKQHPTSQINTPHQHPPPCLP
jgi:hypothetical protein